MAGLAGLVAVMTALIVVENTRRVRTGREDQASNRD
jgi:hypothetical protein